LGMIQYWSGAPISMGRYEIGRRVPVKFMAIPCDAPYLSDSEMKADFSAFEKGASTATLTDAEKNYGRTWLKKLAGKYDICYDLALQIQTKADSTSVEDGLNEWSVMDSPPVVVARLVMPKQNFDTPKQNKFCEQLHFNPWNALEAHTPMGDSNQARGLVYASSKQKRDGHDWTRNPPASEPSLLDHPLAEKK